MRQMQADTCHKESKKFHFDGFEKVMAKEKVRTRRMTRTYSFSGGCRMQRERDDGRKKKVRDVVPAWEKSKESIGEV